MNQDDENVTESEWREAFRQRLRQVQGARTGDDMADLLGITRDAYSKYVGGRASAVPIRLLPKLARIGAVSLEWLIEGDKTAKVSVKDARQPRKTARQR